MVVGNDQIEVQVVVQVAKRDLAEAIFSWVVQIVGAGKDQVAGRRQVGEEDRQAVGQSGRFIWAGEVEVRGHDVQVAITVEVAEGHVLDSVQTRVTGRHGGQRDGDSERPVSDPQEDQDLCAGAAAHHVQVTVAVQVAQGDGRPEKLTRSSQSRGREEVAVGRSQENGLSVHQVGNGVVVQIVHRQLSVH